jgi:hypothetical protein
LKRLFIRCIQPESRPQDTVAEFVILLTAPEPVRADVELVENFLLTSGQKWTDMLKQFR